MPRVLLIDSDRKDLALLQTALADAGYAVTAVASGSFALTLIERDRPDLIVSRTHVEDIEGHELREIVQSDPTTNAVPFLLVAHEGPAAVLSEVRRLLTPAGGDGPRGLQGTFGVMSLVELVQAIALGGKTGELRLSLATGRGAVVFHGGRLLHAEFGERTGERAFAALVSASQREAEATFAFTPADHDAATPRRTIHRSVEQLLFAVATEMDEAEPRAPGAPTA
ncbi:MAG: DUF4388 domain-containing protein [Candidatus Rokubacteria bacterium]|nr:DUF4388 domain-containing protein [Candidatus Rokubacteria bacterium]